MIEAISGAGVYAVRARSAPRVIKIGQTVNIKNRICGMQVSSPRRLEVIAFIVELDVWRREELEQALHSRFESYQTRGEWFEFDNAGMDSLAVAFGLEGRRALRSLELITPSGHDQPTKRHGSGGKPHTISFRCDDEQVVLANALRTTFDPPTHSQAFQWLLSSAEGLALIASRVRGEI